MSSASDPNSMQRGRLVTASELLVDAFSQLRDADPAPSYIQIKRCIRFLVADGTLEAGRRLPTVRALAHQLGLATNTVARAYAELVSQRVVISRAGGGIARALVRGLERRGVRYRNRVGSRLRTVLMYAERRYKPGGSAGYGDQRSQSV